MFALVVCACASSCPFVVCVRLDAHDYHAREAASDWLAASYPASRPALCRALSHLSPEVRRRAAEALSRGVAAGRKQIVRKVNAVDHVPCIDCLWYDAKVRRYDPQTPFELALSKTYGSTVHRSDYSTFAYRKDDAGGNFPAYRITTRDLLADLYTAGAPDWAVYSFLSYMRSRDAHFFQEKPGASLKVAPPEAYLIWPF